MTPNPLFGVLLHWLGGLAAGSFYVPYRGVKLWSWETYWLVGGFFSWIVAPWAFGLALTHDLLSVLAAAQRKTLFWAWFFGLLWGLGGLTFGLTMRYLGVALGYGVALGICAVFGTLAPPLFKQELASIAASVSGQVVLTGVGLCVVGIAFTAISGLRKERELPEQAKKEAVSEFNLKKGLAVALFCGVLSACFAFGLEAAAPLADLSAAAGTPALWSGLPKLVVILAGAFTSNGLWCLVSHLRNGTGNEYLKVRTFDGARVPRATNVVLCAVAGITWYLQFFFYTMGETKMGHFGYSSWTLHMASIIIFSALWGIALKEWRGTSRRTHVLVGAGIAVLVLSTIVVGYGTYLKGSNQEAARSSSLSSHINVRGVHSRSGVETQSHPQKSSYL